MDTCRWSTWNGSARCEFNNQMVSLRLRSAERAVHFPECRCLGHLWAYNEEQTPCNCPTELQFMVGLNLNSLRGGGV